MNKIVECVPNFCDGQNQKLIDEIRNAITSQPGIEFKCVDSGFYANRSVYTFLGDEKHIFNAAYKSIETAVKGIDMRLHKGAHPRFGAVDVFPFVALRNITNEDLIPQVDEFAKKVAQDFKISTYLYEKSAKRPQTKNLADIRKGEYEGLEMKMQHPDWEPDFHPQFNPKSGGMAMGVRDLLVAFNVNLDTQDVEIAKQIAAEIRHSGKLIRDQHGNRIRRAGRCPGVKALGWYIRDFDKVQVSMNIVDITKTPVHIAFETCQQIATSYGVNVTGSELIGCIPRKCLKDAELYFHNKYADQNANYELNSNFENSIKYLNLNEVKPFDLEKNIIEYDGV